MNRRPRLAWASPLPPASSGIADYSADLLPELARRADLELFVDGTSRADDPLATRHPSRQLSALDSREAGRFDFIVYQIGNSAPHHAAIYRKAVEIPGVVVLHEFMLHHLVREMTLARGDARGYVHEMRYCAGRSGELAARRLLDTHFPVDVWSFPLFERLVDRGLGVIVHSEFARQRVLASRPLARVERVPMGIELAPPGLDSGGSEERGRTRAALGIADQAFLIATFGFVTPQKRLEPALAAFAKLRAEHPTARFAIVGEVSPHYDLDEVLARTEAGGVAVVGRVQPERFTDWMRACDLAVNLRHPTGGETSASLLRLMALGRPVVVSTTGSFAEVPEGACIQLPLDAFEAETLAELFRRLAASRELSQAIGAAARRFVEREHSLAASAESYVAALVRLFEAPMAPIAPCPPLVAGPVADPWPTLFAAVGSELADLGLGEDDEESLAEISARLAELA